MKVTRVMTAGIFLGIALGVGVFARHATGVSAQGTSAGAPTIAPIPSPAGANAGEPQLTVSNRGVLLSWIEHAGTKTTLRFAERTRNGWTEPRTVASGEDWSVNAEGRAGGAPRVARHADELVFAWTEGSRGTSQVRTAVARTPARLTQ